MLELVRRKWNNAMKYFYRKVPGASLIDCVSVYRVKCPQSGDMLSATAVTPDLPPLGTTGRHCLKSPGGIIEFVSVFSM